MLVRSTSLSGLFFMRDVSNNMTDSTDIGFCYDLSDDECPLDSSCSYQTNTEEGADIPTCGWNVEKCTELHTLWGDRWQCPGGGLYAKGTMLEVDNSSPPPLKKNKCCLPHCVCPHTIVCEIKSGEKYHDAAGNDIPVDGCACVHEGDKSCIPRVDKTGQWCAEWKDQVCMCSAGSSSCQNVNDNVWQ